MVKEVNTVCVTGASGFIGSWLVMRLLERGYIVRATVRDPGNPQKVKHLLELPKADTNLILCRADLTEEGSFDEAIKGCHAVFHMATPMDIESQDPEASLYFRPIYQYSVICKYIIKYNIRCFYITERSYQAYRI